MPTNYCILGADRLEVAPLMNIRISLSNPFARNRALPHGRATAPFAKTTIAALLLIGLAHSASSQIPRTDKKPKPFITKTNSRNRTSKPEAGKPGAKKQPGNAATPNLAKEPTLYVVGYAHLDTEWRWEYP